MTTKHIKRLKYIILTILCVVGLIFVFCFFLNNQKEPKEIKLNDTKKNDYKKIYRAYVNKHSLYEGLKPGEYGNDEIKLIYKFDDIDGDGIPEFIYERKNINVVADFVYILTIKKDKVIRINELIGENGYLEYYPRKNIIRVLSSHQGIDRVIYLEMSDKDKLKRVASSMEIHSEVFANQKDEFVINGKGCSEKEFKEYESRLEKYEVTCISPAERHGEKDLDETAFSR